MRCVRTPVAVAVAGRAGVRPGANQAEGGARGLRGDAGSVGYEGSSSAVLVHGRGEGEANCVCG